MFFAGEFPHKIEAVFLLGLRGFLWVRIMGSQNVLGSGYGSNISVVKIPVPFSVEKEYLESKY
jgi:hypothetical protein